MARKLTSAPQRIKDSEFLKTARERFKWADESDNEQAQRERNDIAFEAGDQWPSDLKLARIGQQPNEGMPAVPARPTLVINKVKPPVRKVLNQERESDLGIELVPADDFGDLGITPDDTEITLREGMLRRIQRDSKAQDARSWAFKRAVIAGRGYYLVHTRYLPGKTNDQEVYVHRIYNQASVLLDPSHEMPDGSDADFGFIGTWMPWDRYKSEFGTLADGEKNPFAESSEADFMAMAEEYPDWYQAESGEHGKRAVRVVDYWYTERVARELVTLPDGTAEWKDELSDDMDVAGLESRHVVEKQIKFCKIGGGIQELEKTDWAGPDMPIVKVVGDEVLPYDAERRYEGMIRPAIGSQMGLNYMISKQVEVVGLTPIPPLMVDPDAISGYEAWYALANVRTFPYLPHRTRNDQGQELREPHRPAVDPNILPIAQSIALFNQSIQDTTDVQDPALGKTDPSVKSARHAERLISQSLEGNVNWIDNLKRSMEYEAAVINNLLYPIYGNRPGRMVRILTGEGESQMMRIGGDPQQAQANQQKALKVGKLTEDAHFNITIKIARSTESRRDQFVAMFGDILSADPTQMGVGGDLFYKNMDIPEAKQLAKRQRAVLHPAIQEMLASEENGEEPLSPAVQAKMQKMEQMLQMANQAVEDLTQKADGKMLDADTKLKIAQLQADRDVALEQARIEADAKKEMAKLDAELEKARMDNATKQYIADVQAKTKGQIQAAEHAHDEMATDTQLAHEAEQKQLDRQGQVAMKAHDAAMADGQADRASEEAERDRQQGAGA